MALLSVKDLSVEFKTDRGPFRAVDGVSWDVEPGEVLCIVGESGSGKSVTAFSVIGLLDAAGTVAGGSAVFEGVDLLKADKNALRNVRGRQISMIFQDPMNSLNPVIRIGKQMREVYETHGEARGKEAEAKAVEMLGKVGIPSPERVIRSYPFELSGGMQQRVCIAMALSLGPKLLIADEPTTALDVTVQAQIVDLMLKIREESGTAIVIITHDLGLVAETADRVVVMEKGRVVETAGVVELFAAPRDDYTKRLLAAVPGSPTAGEYA